MTAATDPPAGAEVQRFPDILAVTIEPEAGGTYTIAATVSSPYDTPARYADGWRVLAPDGRLLAERELLHDHANEQPFTRSLSGVVIPPEIGEITVEGRDREYGYGGATVTVAVP
ncbi:MAG: hypothetical protein HC822_08255 [Oscillochloris sp.]|nr:hypothetical protein [Oscillochloris sp.]